jgi:hypothetical protein
MGELDAVRQLIVDRVPNLKAMSLELGRAHSFLWQFVRRGTPAELPDVCGNYWRKNWMCPRIVCVHGALMTR